VRLRHPPKITPSIHVAEVQVPFCSPSLVSLARCPVTIRLPLSGDRHWRRPRRRVRISAVRPTRSRPRSRGTSHAHTPRAHLTGPAFSLQHFSDPQKDFARLNISFASPSPHLRARTQRTNDPWDTRTLNPEPPNPKSYPENIRPQALSPVPEILNPTCSTLTPESELNPKP
jgi:hypothetical protein